VFIFSILGVESQNANLVIGNSLCLLISIWLHYVRFLRIHFVPRRAKMLAVDFLTVAVALWGNLLIFGICIHFYIHTYMESSDIALKDFASLKIYLPFFFNKKNVMCPKI